LDKIRDPFAVSLTVSKKLHTKVPILAPPNHRHFYGDWGWFLRDSNA
jgi:hypothetical protein